MHTCITFHSLLFSDLQEQEENKSATSWPEYYIDQLNSMAAVSNNHEFYLFFSGYKNCYEMVVEEGSVLCCSSCEIVKQRQIWAF